MAIFYNWSDVPQRQFTPEIAGRIISGEKTMTVQFTLKKGGVVSEHAHPHEQIAHVISGRIEFTLGSETRILGPGDVVVIPPNMPHSARILEDTINIEIFSPPREDFLVEALPDYMKQ
ncbi:MAG TPA: cupin domain-containing protein [Anaerolineae bacterium]|mgnify:CR=1 FL=1|nr:cupin domain-containing protein [Anaerolineae bacterium]